MSFFETEQRKTKGDREGKKHTPTNEKINK